jgi:hypothetical protein
MGSDKDDHPNVGHVHQLVRHIHASLHILRLVTSDKSPDMSFSTRIVPNASDWSAKMPPEWSSAHTTTPARTNLRDFLRLVPAYTTLQCLVAGKHRIVVPPAHRLGLPPPDKVATNEPTPTRTYATYSKNKLGHIGFVRGYVPTCTHLVC